MTWFDKYIEEISPEPIALYEVMGNEIFDNEFNGDPEQLYKYCVENKKTWREVLNFKFDESLLY